MEDTNKMLSQDEIDAFVSKASSKPSPAHKIASSGSVSVKPSAAAIALKNVQKVSTIGASTIDAPQPAAGGGHSHDECIAAGDISSLHEHVGEIIGRLSRLEVLVSKIENDAGRTTSQINPATVKAAIQQVQNVSSQVEVISEGLRGTAGYNISKVFNCSSCGSVGVVAIKVKCTKCGQENWWGWWPKKK